MTLASGAAGGKAAARAMAEYLLEKQVADGTMRAAEYYGRTQGAEAAIAAGQGCAPAPRADMAPEVAAALGLDPTRPLTTEHLANLLGGLRADGAPLAGAGRSVGTYTPAEGSDAKERHTLAYLDLTLSAPKSFSVAWALAGTEAERATLLQAHRTAVAETMAYVEDQIGWARTGKAGAGPLERARLGYVTCDHFTARPTTETVRTDPATGEVYTDLRSLRVTGDPQVHTHVIVPNVMVAEGGRVTALNSRLVHGNIHHFGAVYQAVLARELRAVSVAVELDERTHLARLPAIPEAVCGEFSNRNRDAEAFARARAAERGVDYDTATHEQRAGFLKLGAAATRLDKDNNTPDMQSWREQAQRIGFGQTSVITHGPPSPPHSEAERMAAADAAGLPHLAEMLSKRAVISGGDVRLAAARGFIAAGIETTADMDAMMRRWAAAGVEQDGQHTRLLCREIEGGHVRLTTELHRDHEAEVIRLASSAAADRTHALAPGGVSAAIAAMGVSYAGEHGEAQRKAVEALGSDGAIAVLVGVAGSGKTSRVLAPLVAAYREKGVEVWGVSLAWRQANALQDSGIDRLNVRAMQPFLDGVQSGRTRVGRNAVVVLDELGQIGTRQLLELLRLREQHGFKIVATGDDRQNPSIEAGAVIALLRRALGPERVPEILTTVRQDSEREREIAGLFRAGQAGAALAAKRSDGTAELVPGGYRDAVQRVAALYVERREANREHPDYRITISAPTNADAREIGRAVRQQRRAMGEITGRDHQVAATDGRGDAFVLDLAAGDTVRLFVRTRGTAVCADGRRRGVAVGDNGSVLQVLAVRPSEGLSVRTDAGTEAFVPWANLRDRTTGRVLLAHGDCLTIDAAQGITSTDHINALPAGSRGVTGFKAYVAESRHRGRSYLVGSMGAEMREAAERRPLGLPVLSPGQASTAAWDNLVRNLERQPVKESALAFLERAVVAGRETAKAFQGGAAGAGSARRGRAGAHHPASHLRPPAREGGRLAPRRAPGGCVRRAAPSAVPGTGGHAGTEDGGPACGDGAHLREARGSGRVALQRRDRAHGRARARGSTKGCADRPGARLRQGDHAGRDDRGAGRGAPGRGNRPLRQDARAGGAGRKCRC